MNKVFFFLLVLVLPITIHAAECARDAGTEEAGNDRVQALKYKLIAIASILLAGAVGVSLPTLGKIFPALSPENDFFFVVKAFAAGVIFATGCVHVLPDSFELLTSPCLSESPWGAFPFAGFCVMVAATATMLVDQVASVLFKRMHFGKEAKVPAASDGEKVGDHEGHVHVHTRATNGHAHGAAFGDEAQLLRHQVISQVLEIGIVVHSVIIGISLGASENPKTIKPLVAALSFHQLFEGMGLGGCISQAKLKATSVTIMSIFFSLTTPVGIAIGFAISNSYNENSPTALIVEGLFNAASAGILLYMALVDLIEVDFKSARVLNNLKLLFVCDVTLLLGMGCMSLLAIWA
ncbi:zinc transporter 4-like [Rhododendron vialii]|uniref:zinc transporter 4-like n=1 Tax=Rhododendron vialii TaxID=182163 RepID=UPI00265F46D5|nr:zinc transporter 4-like [Rhododendron vialii]